MSRKTIKFMVDIVLKDEVPYTDEHKEEMAENIAEAIKIHANRIGIVPEGMETFTDVIYVKEWYSYQQHIIHP